MDTYNKPKSKQKNLLVSFIIIFVSYVSLTIWCICYTWFINNDNGNIGDSKFKMLTVMFATMLFLGSFIVGGYSLFIGRKNKLLWLKIVNIVFDWCWVILGLISLFSLLGDMAYWSGQDYGDLLMKPMNKLISSWTLISVSIILCIPSGLSLVLYKKVKKQSNSASTK